MGSRMSRTSGKRTGQSANQTQHSFSTQTEPFSSLQAKGQIEGYPPLAPPRRKKDKLIPDISVFKQIDTHVKTTPRSTTTSLSSLANYLFRPCNSDIQKLRAIYCWIAHNIEYDVESLASGNKQPQDVQSVLRTRKAVCQGYAQLCKELCDSVKIPCILVEGISKGFGYNPDKIYTADTKTDHAWNLVFVDGEWRPLECTWGAGHMNDEDRRFIREFSERWFLTDPLKFLPTHFPYMDRDLKTSRAYQLVSKPISLDQFSAMLKPESYALDIGLQYISHKNAVICVKYNATIKLKASKRLETASASLSQGTNKRKDRSCVLTSLEDDGTCNVFVQPQSTSDFLLTIFGRAEGEGGTTLKALVTYSIKCKQAKQAEAFPDKDGIWGFLRPTAVECGLKKSKNTPFMYSAKNGEVVVPIELLRKSINMSVTLHHACAMTKDLKDFTLIEYDDKGVVIHARLQQTGYYLLRVFASHPNTKEDQLSQAADFLIHCDKALKDCQPFPRPFTFAQDQRIRLLQPLTCRVPRNSETLYRVYAPTLGKLIVAEHSMTLKKGGIWEASVVPNESTVTIFGAVDKNASRLNGLYQFDVSF